MNTFVDPSLIDLANACVMSAGLLYKRTQHFIVCMYVCNDVNEGIHNVLKINTIILLEAYQWRMHEYLFGS